MEFNEQKAVEIITRLGLKNETINVWRLRGRIPNRYNDENSKSRNWGGKRISNKVREKKVVSQHLKIDRDLVEKMDKIKVNKSRFASESIREKFERMDK